MYRICIVYVTCMYRRLYGKGIENGQGWDRESTGKIRGRYGERSGKVTDYKGALWVMT